MIIFSRTAKLLAALGLGASLAVAPATAGARVRAQNVRPRATAGAVHYWFANANYNANENVRHYPLVIRRSNASQPGKICWGVTNASAEPGHNFEKLGKQNVYFAAGQSQATVSFPVYDQGIHGPSGLAKAYMYHCGGNTVVNTPHEIIHLLQNDPLQSRNPANLLGYQQPTNGDPLQHVRWYVFGGQSAAGKAARRYRRSHPKWARDLRLLADTPGALSYRFWMWNQPAHSLASHVEKYLANVEAREPGTTVPLSTYSLVHGHCLNPNTIRKRYQQWVTQLARGIGNFRVVLYLEEDSLISTGCLNKQQVGVRMKDELAYAVKALTRDPHVLVYLDAGAPDIRMKPRRIANLLKMADVRQAQGFLVNTTHHWWTSSSIHWGQEIARMTGGAHFIVSTGSSGRGPLLNRHPRWQGIENLCNPPGRGLGPMSWNTGLKYLDGMLWFNNPGGSDGPCGHNDPPVPQFWPQYAIGLVNRWVHRITGPRVRLIHSKTDM